MYRGASGSGSIFFAQLADKRHDVAVVQQVVIRPHRPVNLFFGKHLAPVLRQKP